MASKTETQAEKEIRAGSTTTTSDGTPTTATATAGRNDNDDEQQNYITSIGIQPPATTTLMTPVVPTGSTAGQQVEALTRPEPLPVVSPVAEDTTDTAVADFQQQCFRKHAHNDEDTISALTDLHSVEYRNQNLFPSPLEAKLCDSHSDTSATLMMRRPARLKLSNNSDEASSDTDLLYVVQELAKRYQREEEEEASAAAAAAARETKMTAVDDEHNEVHQSASSSLLRRVGKVEEIKKAESTATSGGSGAEVGRRGGWPRPLDYDGDNPRSPPSTMVGAVAVAPFAAAPVESNREEGGGGGRRTQEEAEDNDQEDGTSSTPILTSSGGTTGSDATTILEARLVTDVEEEANQKIQRLQRELEVYERELGVLRGQQQPQQQQNQQSVNGDAEGVSTSATTEAVVVAVAVAEPVSVSGNQLTRVKDPCLASCTGGLGDLMMSNGLVVTATGKIDHHSIMPRNSNHEHQSSQVEAYAASRLRIDKLGIVGREEHMQTLHRSLDRACSNSSSRELVFIGGESGTGKTRLASTLRKRVVKHNKGVFCIGRFNAEDQTGLPYRAIADACSQICMLLLGWRTRTPGSSSEEAEDRSKAVESIQQQINTKLGTSQEIHMVAGLVPQLYELAGWDSTHSVQMAEVDHLLGNDQAKARFVYAFQTFFHILSAAIQPLCFVLDDMQWADTSSLELLQSLIADLSNSNLFMIFLSRSNGDAEQEQARMYGEFIESIETNQQGLGGVQVSHLTTEPLTAPMINELLIECLDYDEVDSPLTYPLAELCHRRTLGNPMFVISFFQLLRDCNLLSLDKESWVWKWDIDQISSQTRAMDNVVEIMQMKIGELPTLMRQRLTVAACFGGSFKANVVCSVLTEMEREDANTSTACAIEDQQDLEKWLSSLESIGFLEAESISSLGDSSVSYRWTHDSVREGALALATAGELQALKTRAGKHLLAALSEEERDVAIFDVANFLNEGLQTENRADRIALAVINKKAALKAIHVSSYSIAAQFSGKGIDLLPPGHWESHKSLTLELFTLAAKTEDMCGLTDSVNARFLAVESRDDVPLADKLEIYFAQIRRLGKASYSSAIGLILNVLEQQGITFPKSTTGKLMLTIRHLLKIKRQCKALTMEDLNQLPDMGVEHVAKLKLLHALGVYSYPCDEYQALMPLAFFTTFKLMLKHGVSVYTPPNLACLGVIFTGITNDFQLGGKMGSLALEILEQKQYSSTASNTLMTVHAFLKCWLAPGCTSAQGLLKGYELGLLSGDTEFAVWNIENYLVLGFQTGRPLAELEADCRTYASQMLHYDQTKALGITEAYWLAFVKLMGKEDEIDPLLGKVFGTMSFSELEDRHNHDPNLAAQLLCLKARLYACFGDHKAGADLAIKRGDEYEKTNLASHVNMPQVFARGVSLYAMAIETRKGRYKRQARKILTRVKRWSKCGNPNVLGYEKMLQAEEARLRGKLESAESLYQSAKVIASRSGLIQDAAVAAERCGEMLLNRGACSEAVAMLRETISLYDAWGAKAKIKQMMQKHGSVLNN